jgi:hypothetical protein
MARFLAQSWEQNEEGLTLVLARSAVFTGSIQGAIELLSSNELRVVTTTQKFPKGSMLYDIGSDSVYRYVEFGGTTAAGDMIQAEGPDGAHDDLSPAGTDGELTKGSVNIVIATSLTTVENEYENGFFVIENDTGQGYLYPIQKNTAKSGAVDTGVTLWRPGLAVAIDATSDCKLIKSRYQEVIQAPSTLTGVLVGAGLGVGADGSFGWVQTRGPAAVLTKGTLAIGNGATVITTAGSLGPRAETDVLESVGHVMDVGPDTEYSVVFLELE